MLPTNRLSFGEGVDLSADPLDVPPNRVHDIVNVDITPQGGGFVRDDYTTPSLLPGARCLQGFDTFALCAKDDLHPGVQFTVFGAPGLCQRIQGISPANLYAARELLFGSRCLRYCFFIGTVGTAGCRRNNGSGDHHARKQSHLFLFTR